MFNFDDAAQNFAYVGLTFPVVVGTATDDAEDELLELPHEARRRREVTMTPAERPRTISFPGICPTYCGDRYGKWGFLSYAKCCALRR